MEKENVENIERPRITEEFVFKNEIFSLFEEEKNKCIRSILWSAEIILQDKNSENYKKMRKSVLDSVNDLHRKIVVLSEKVI
jgi:hypothetical protein